MDPMMVLGIRQGPRSPNDLLRLQKRCKQLRAYYLGKERKQDAKKVDWAFEQIKKASKLELPRPKAPSADEAGSKGGRGGDAQKRPLDSAEGDGGGGRELRGDVKRRAREARDPNARREAIREKLTARRQEKSAAGSLGGGERITENARRQEGIREKLQAKRIIKQVLVQAEEECRKGVKEALASGSGDDARPGQVCLICPISIERIKTPARGKQCRHLQCFDLEAYLLNKCRCCPVCDIPLAPPADLFIDSLFARVLISAKAEANEVVFDAEGSWQALEASEEEDEEMSPAGKEDAMPADDSPPGTPAIGWEEDGGEDEAELEAAANTKAAAAAAATAAASQQRVVEQEDREEEGRRKLKALLPFIPRTGRRPDSKVKAAVAAAAVAADLDDEPPAIGTEDENSYVAVEMPKPMGIVFEANPPPTGGVRIASFDEGGAAATHGRLRVGDQLVGVGRVSVLSRDVDACIDLIISSEGEAAKITVYRGRAAHLYGKVGPSAEWIADLLRRVSDGQVRLSPPLERRAGKQHKLSMPLSEGGSSSEDAGFSDELDAEEGGETASRLPAAVAESLRGDGLDADACRCAEALQDLERDVAPVQRAEASDALPRSVLRACIEQNLGEWVEMEGKRAWRRAAGKRMAEALTARARRLDRETQERRESERLLALAAREGSGGEEDAGVDGALLILDPAGVIEFGERGTAYLALRNSAPGFVAYRVRTNAPRHTSVQPCVGTLRKGERALAKIVATDRRAGGSSLKFVVQAAEVPGAAAVSREEWHAFDKAAIQEWTLDGHWPR